MAGTGRSTHRNLESPLLLGYALLLVMQVQHLVRGCVPLNSLRLVCVPSLWGAALNFQVQWIMGEPNIIPLG